MGNGTQVKPVSLTIKIFAVYLDYILYLCACVLWFVEFCVAGY